MADELERWVDVGGVDGFNLAYVITPGTFEDIAEHLTPELRRRGLLAADARPGATLRERLSGSAVVPEWHPAHAYRGAFAGSRTAADGGASLVPTTV